MGLSAGDVLPIPCFQPVQGREWEGEMEQIEITGMNGRLQVKDRIVRLGETHSPEFPLARK